MLSGKVLEVPVKRILMGTPAGQAASRDSLANPGALDYFTEMGAELAAQGRDGGEGGRPRGGRPASTGKPQPQATRSPPSTSLGRCHSSTSTEQPMANT